MINMNLRLNLPSATVDEGLVITVYFKSRINIIGTCFIQQNESGETIGSFTIAEELHDDIFVLFIYGAIKEEVILEGILFDDSTHNKTLNTLGSLKIY